MKPITAIAVLLLLVTSLSVSGCTVTNTDNPSPTRLPIPSSLYQIKTTTTNATSNAITANYASNGYKIVKAFTKGTNQYGNVVYTGTLNDKNATHLKPYQHNVTIELIKNKTETKQRVSQLAAIYSSWGFPANMTGTYLQSDSAGNQIEMGGCDPNMICLSGLSMTFDQFTVILDVQTKSE